METIKIKNLSGGYKNTFLNNVVSPIVMPEGFKRVRLGVKLQIPMAISINTFSEEVAMNSSWMRPEEYGHEDYLPILQRQPDGRWLIGWDTSGL